MLKIIRKKRYAAGNICLVLFTALLFSIVIGTVGNVDSALAAPKFVNNNQIVAGDYNTSVFQGQNLEIKLIPTTNKNFDKIVIKFPQLGDLTVYADLNTYDVLDVYKVFQFVYGLPNNAPTETYKIPVYVYYENDSFPEIVYLDLTIEPPVDLGGGAVVLPPTQSQTTETGTVTVDKTTGEVSLKVDDSKVTAQIKAGATVALEVPVTSETTKAKVEASTAVFTKAAEAGATLAVKPSADTVVNIAPNTFAKEVLASLGTDAKVEIAFNATEEVVKETIVQEQKVISRVYEVSFEAVKADGTRVKLSPANPVRMTFTYDVLPAAEVEAQKVGAVKNALQILGFANATSAVDEDKLGVYKYNEATKKWEYVGGKVNKVTKKIEADITSFGKFSVMAYDKKFTDVPNTYWANREIEVMAAKHIAKGYGDSFKPENSITRGDFTVLLMRALGYAEATGNTFTDVTEAYNKGFIEAALKTGIVNGYGAEFKPNKEITREEMAVIIARAMTKQGYVSDATAAELEKFADKANIEGYAVEGIAIAAKAGIVLGKTDGSFDPDTDASRAQTIVMLKRLLGALDRI